MAKPQTSQRCENLQTLADALFRRNGGSDSRVFSSLDSEAK